jgi:hypothetical protein
MTRSRKYALLALLSVASATCAFAQTETPTRNQTDPSAASSPHQRDATQNAAQEAPATQGPEATDAATPHQKEVTDKAKHDQMMKDCMRKEQAKDSSLSKDEVKKACADQMKSMKSDSSRY